MLGDKVRKQEILTANARRPRKCTGLLQGPWAIRPTCASACWYIFSSEPAPSVFKIWDAQGTMRSGNRLTPASSACIGGTIMVPDLLLPTEEIPDLCELVAVNLPEVCTYIGSFAVHNR